MSLASERHLKRSMFWGVGEAIADYHVTGDAKKGAGLFKVSLDIAHGLKEYILTLDFRPAALSAIPLRLVAPTRLAPTSTVSLVARLALSRASRTQMPTGRKASPGRRRLCSPTSRTRRSTFPAPRWPSVA